MSTVVRTRFAPSPTGFLHVGSARTALYAYLYAKKHQGVFILRIEDTDLERSTPEAVQAILQGMMWLGLTPDEGPYYQTLRFERYREVARQLLAEGKAYRCYCSKERLEALRADQQANKQKPRYDGHCRHEGHHEENKNTSAPFVIRFANPQDGEVCFDDAVHGSTVFHNRELDDLIIVRSDGVPTYNFTVVVDDWDMKITHVIRGDDHLNNTPRQINILRALGAPVPVYAHIPMILGTDGKKLSKRHGAVSVMQYRDEGFLPQALLNYLVRLGWSHGDQEIFCMEEMIGLFDITGLNRSAAAFNPDKLRWLNQHYLKTADIKSLEAEFIWQLKRLGMDIFSADFSAGPKASDIIQLQRERCKTMLEMADRSWFFYENTPPSAELQAKYFTDVVRPAIKALAVSLAKLTSDDWQDENIIQQQIVSIAEQFNLKLGDLAQPVRVALTGGTVSPPLNSTIRVLGRETVLARLRGNVG